MKKVLEAILGFIGLWIFGAIIAYALIYALDSEADLQEQRESRYLYERGLK